MFTIAGILADEEPKTPISPNGLYNSSDLSTGGSDLNSTLLSGRSEFTFMLWLNADFSQNSPDPYIEFSPIGIIPIKISSTTAIVNIDNSNGGKTTISHTISNSTNTWYHWTVTGSVSNNRVRLYRNGTLVASAVMTYSNITTGQAKINQEDGTSISQLNMYDRELTQSEVAEHYLDIDGQIGILSYDAMTTAQRSGLIYSSSLTDNISFSGNEFKDRSGNNITLSPQPDLTGQQIYVYTDASDGPNTFASSVATLDGSTQYLERSDLGILDGATNFHIGIWVNFNSTTGSPIIIDKWLSSGNQRQFEFYHNHDTDTTIFNYDFTGSTQGQVAVNQTLVADTWYHIAVERDSSGDVRFYTNGSQVGSEQNIGTTGLYNNTAPLVIGASSLKSVLFLDGSLGFMTICSDDGLVTDLYNGGTPPCYADIPTDTKTKIDASGDYWYLGNFNGNDGSELIGQANGNDLTNNTSVTYESELEVECDEDPV